MVRLSAYLNLLFDEGSDPERVARVADVGYDAVELYGFDRDLAGVARAVADHDLEWVYLSGERPDFTDPGATAAAVKSVERSIDLARRHGVPKVNVKAGATQSGLDDEAQRRNVVEVVRCGAQMAEGTDVTLVLEPVNATVDHPGHFTTTAAEGAEIVRAVGHPNARLLFDVYHEQVASGDLIRSLREHEDVIGHVHVADNPGRHQPGTGEINYATVFDALDDSSYDGFVGCEFVPTADSDPESVLRSVAEMA